VELNVGMHQEYLTFLVLHYFVRFGITQWYSTGLRAGKLGGFESRQGLGIFLFTTASRPALKVHLVSYPMDTMGTLLDVKRSGREADHSPPGSAEVKNALNYTSIHLIQLHCLVLS
jgi:hypothetical protein